MSCRGGGLAIAVAFAPPAYLFKAIASDERMTQPALRQRLAMT
jgi:hypothetical protein